MAAVVTAPPVRLSNLSAGFADRGVLRQVNLDGPPGRVLAIVGPSGCGKSTVLRCINRLHELDEGAFVSGDVSVGTLPVYASSTDVIALRRRVGMVFQRPTPFVTASVFDNVAAGVRAHRRSIAASELEGLVEDALQRSLHRGAGIRVLTGDYLEITQADADILTAVAPHARREALADAGLNFVSRATPQGRDYFVTNLGAKAHEGWVSVGPAARALVMNPLNGDFGFARSRPAANRALEVFLQVAPGESLILRTTRTAPPAKIAPWSNPTTAAAPVPLTGPWKISFTKGGPPLPPALETNVLQSWTDLGGDEAQRFGGTARYRLEFDFDSVVARAFQPVSGNASAPSPAQAARATPRPQTDDWHLELGDVRESARVIFNGQPVATAWSLPFRVRLASALLKPGRNILELDVTNLAANRIRYMDQNKLPWKIMRDTNVVNINYRPFDASAWPLTPSGLLGPVTLTPLKSFQP
jgi:ABC-type sugar transport system ATPase subunit